ncbi:hypothetical protein BH18ACT5_BH18ACT5_12460 [soil metagenome]
MQTQTVRRWPTTAVVITIVLAVLLAVIGVAAVVGAVAVGRLRADNEDLGAQIEAAEDRIGELESQLAAAESSGSGDLLGEGGLGDLLGGLLGGGEGGDLGALEDLLGGLLGGDSGNLDDLLGGMTGGVDMGALGQCLTGTPGAYTISDSSLAAQVDDIAAAVEQIRELSFPGEIDPTFVSSEEMGERVRDLAAESYPPELAEYETRLWVALGMLEPGFDLVREQLDLLDGAVAGYYDPETGELVVATNSSEEPLGATDQVTLAHELIHALTDARLRFPDSVDDPTTDPERARAIQALIEGDATLGMQQFSMGAIDILDQFGMMLDPRLAASQEDLSEFPYILSGGIQLPYLEGMNFTCALFSDGGWDRVDEAYANPPETTAEILFPERYLEGWSPREPAVGGNPGESWTPLDPTGSGAATGFGAIDLLNLFSAPGDNTTAALDNPRERVAAWGGGQARVWSQGEHTAVLLSFVDSNTGGTRLCDSMLAWETAAYGGDEPNVIINCGGDNLLVAVAPDEATAAALVG